MKITIIRAKKLALALLALPLLAAFTMPPAPASTVEDFDAAATYKAKCAMCHGQKAEKKFDVAKDDAHHVSITLKGKDDVTPKMPGYEAKGMTEEQAKAIVAYMRTLRQ